MRRSTTPSWTTRLSLRSSGSLSPRFSRRRRINAASSALMMIRASEPPMNKRRSTLALFELPVIMFLLPVATPSSPRDDRWPVWSAVGRQGAGQQLNPDRIEIGDVPDAKKKALKTASKDRRGSLRGPRPGALITPRSPISTTNSAGSWRRCTRSPWPRTQILASSEWIESDTRNPRFPREPWNSLGARQTLPFDFHQ